MTYEEEVIQWYEERERFYKGLGEALKLLGPVMANKQDEDLLRLFIDDADKR